jgi:hypothetical protein
MLNGLLTDVPLLLSSDKSVESFVEVTVSEDT